MRAARLNSRSTNAESCSGPTLQAGTAASTRENWRRKCSRARKTRTSAAFAAIDALAAGGIGLLLVIIARGGFGISDVKLLAYTGAAVSLAGGALALAVVVERGMHRGMTMPFEPVIAAGCAWALLVG